MKKAMILFAGLIFGQVVFGQAVKDRAVIPVAVNLNRVLRLTIENGGNIEFTFNTIDQYKNGINSGGISVSNYYNTIFTVSSSVRWFLNFGSEQSVFRGTDYASNTMALDNVGFALINGGAHLFGTELTSGFFTTVPTAADVSALVTYGTARLIDDNGNAAANAGDGSDNKFELRWRCGTMETTGTANNKMSSVALIDKAVGAANPDRYVVNVIMDLQPN